MFPAFRYLAVGLLLCLVLCVVVACVPTVKTPPSPDARVSKAVTIDHKRTVPSIASTGQIQGLVPTAARLQDRLPQTPTYREMRNFVISHLQQIARIVRRGPETPRASHRHPTHHPTHESPLQHSVQALALLLQQYPWFGMSNVWHTHLGSLRTLWSLLREQPDHADFSENVAILYLGLVPFFPDLKAPASWYRGLQTAIANVWKSPTLKLRYSPVVQMWALRCWDSAPVLGTIEGQLWRDALRSKSWGMRWWALRSLHGQSHRSQTWLQHRKEWVHKDILHLLADEHPDVQGEISRVLTVPPRQDAWESWFHRMKDTRWWVRRTVAAVVRGWGDSSVRILLSRLEHADISVRLQSAYILTGMSSRLQAVNHQAVLARVLEQERESAVLRQLVQVIGRWQYLSPALVRVWQRRLQTRDRLVRQAMIQQMLSHSRLFRKWLVPALKQELRQADWRWQKQAVLALQQQKEAGLLAQVMREGHRHFRVRTEAITAMGRLGKKARPYLSQLRDFLASDSWRIRYAAAEAFHHLGREGTSAMSELARTISDKNWGVRAASAGALAKMGSVALDTLEPLLRDSSERTRVMAVDALSKMKEASLRRMRLFGRVLQEDSSVMVRYEAILAMSRMVAWVKHVYPALQKALRDRDWGIRKQAILLLQSAQSLHRFRRDLLRLAVKDPASAVRETAVVALSGLRTLPKKTLLLALSDRHWRVRWYALQSIARWVARMGTWPTGLRRVMRKNEKDPIPQIQKAAMLVGLVGGKSAEYKSQSVSSTSPSRVQISTALARLMRGYEQAAWSMVMTALSAPSLSVRLRTLRTMRSFLPDVLAFFNDCTLQPKKRMPPSSFCRYVAKAKEHPSMRISFSGDNATLRSWGWPILWLWWLREVLAMSEPSLQPIALQIARMLQQHQLVSRQELTIFLRHPDVLGWKNWASCGTWRGQ